MRCLRSVMRPHDSVRFRTNPQALLRKVRQSGRIHHQNSAPDCSQLGVFTSGPHEARGLLAHSACARGWSETVPMVASSPLFCPLFSRSLCQLFRRSTRTSPYATTSCACVGFMSSPTVLDEGPRSEPRQAPFSEAECHLLGLRGFLASARFIMSLTVLGLTSPRKYSRISSTNPSTFRRTVMASGCTVTLHTTRKTIWD